MSAGQRSKRYRKLPVSPSGSGVSPRVHAFHTGANTPLEWMVYKQRDGPLCTYTSLISKMNLKQLILKMHGMSTS